MEDIIKITALIMKLPISRSAGVIFDRNSIFRFSVIFKSLAHKCFTSLIQRFIYSICQPVIMLHSDSLSQSNLRCFLSEAFPVNLMNIVLMPNRKCHIRCTVSVYHCTHNIICRSYKCNNLFSFSIHSLPLLW